MSALKILLPLEYYEDSARKCWAPFFAEDANDSNHRLGWDGLTFMAKKLGVSTKGFAWNSQTSKRRLAKRLMQAKIEEVRREWSTNISTGLYEVMDDATTAATR